MRVRWTLVPLGAALLLSGLGLPAPAAAQGRGPAPVVVAPVETRTLEAIITLVGTVHPATRSLIASEVPGIVVKFPVEEGQRVKKGQTLAQLRATPILIDIQAAKATLEKYIEELKELERGSRPEEVEEARAALQRTEAEYANAQREAARRKDLYEQQVVAIEQYQIATTAAQAAAGRVAEARAVYERIKTGPRRERIEGARAQVASQKAVVARLEDQMKQSSITAPFPGVVVKEHTEVGQWLDRGDPVVELLDLSTVEVIVPVPERYIAEVRRGEAASLALDALPGRSFTGRISQVIPQADAESRTFPVKIQVANPDGLIKSGMFARVTLPVGRARRAIVVPKDALVSHGPVDILFVVDDGVARQVAVKRGQATGAWVAVDGPVEEGQLVVVRGNERLRDGMPVTVVPPDKAGATAGDGAGGPS
ncbi:MAG: efflux RND transporter periplasmic adaptor subunit [Nitrospinae bacterium]|nr:efflux RND transporter periplasmic adaptor subunit [Nitrospinota bacterium]